MRRVETRDQGVGEKRRIGFRVIEQPPISCMDQLEAAKVEAAVKAPDDLAQGRQTQRGKIPAGGAKLIEGAEQMIRRAPNRFGREVIRLEHSREVLVAILWKLHAFLGRS